MPKLTPVQKRILFIVVYSILFYFMVFYPYEKTPIDVGEVAFDVFRSVLSVAIVVYGSIWINSMFEKKAAK